jgi:hypothetical protein
MSERDPSAEGGRHGPEEGVIGSPTPPPAPDPWAGSAWSDDRSTPGPPPPGPPPPGPPPAGPPSAFGSPYGDAPAAPAAPDPAAPGAPPLLAWAPPTAPQAPPARPTYQGPPPAFTIGALLSDTFARYGADPLRLFAVGFVPAILSFLATFSTNPFTVTPGAAGANAVLSLLSFVVGIIGTSVLFALIDGGRAASLGTVLRRGFARSGWVFLTLVLFVLILLVGMLVAAIPAIVLFFVSPALGAVFLFVAFLVAIWLSLRLYLALPGVVADNLNTIDALRLSWRITGSSGVWLRVLGAAVVLGVLIGPASIASGFLILAVAFVPVPVLLLVAGLVLGFLAPFASLLTYAAYRRLVPPAAPAPGAPAPAVTDAFAAGPAPFEPADETPLALAGAQPPVAWADPAASAPTPSSRPGAFWTPPFGTAARVILGITLVLGIGGLIAVPIAAGQLLARLSELGGPGAPGVPGLPGFQVGNVPAGTVAFGTSADLVTCTIEGQLAVVPASGSFVWLGSLTSRVRPSDDVSIRVTLGGQEFANIAQPPGSYDCLGTDEPEVGLPPGTYTFEILVNGQPRATGTVFVL